jgi:hypothetical protein
MWKMVLWLAFAGVPIIALWIFESVVALEGYEGTCGLLSRGVRCTKWEYIEDHLLNAFVAPGLIAVSATWLLMVAIGAVAFLLFRKRDRKGSA